MRYIFALLTATTAALLLLLVGAGLSVQAWFLELIISMTPQILILASGLIIVSLLLLPRGHRIKKHSAPSDATSSKPRVRFEAYNGLIILVVVILAAGFSLRGIYNENESPMSSIRVSSFNKLNENDDLDRIARYMQDNRSDVIAMQEVSSEDLEAQRLRSGYLYASSSQSINTDSAGSVGLLSMHPIENVSFIDFGGGYGALRGEIRMSTLRFVIYSIHNAPPFSTASYAAGRSSLQLLGERLNAEVLPTVVAGDFNTTNASPKLRGFTSNVASTSHPSTRTPFPSCSWYGFDALFCMKIDHIYVPVGAKIISTDVSTDLGSDHRLITTEYIL